MLNKLVFFLLTGVCMCFALACNKDDDNSHDNGEDVVLAR